MLPDSDLCAQRQIIAAFIESAAAGTLRGKAQNILPAIGAQFFETYGNVCSLSLMLRRDCETDKLYTVSEEDGHKVWGWVIYRCTYESDEEWAEFMRRLRYYVEDTLRFDNALDMLPSLDYTVFEDRDGFADLHPSDILEHFTQWAAAAPQQEQGEGKRAARSQRYNYCLHVDQAAVQSVINGPAPPADNLGNGFVNLVCWRMSGGIRPEHTEDRDERDHCWMRICYQDLMVTWYNLFRQQGSWHTEYRVPPEVGRT